jgi:transposase
MSDASQDLVHRHSLTDAQWEVLQKLIVYPPIGRPPVDERRNINGILWILKTGAPWRDLPKEFGYWNTVYQRFLTFTMNGTLGQIFKVLLQMKYDIGEIDLEFAAIDGTIIRVHKAAAGAPSQKKTNRKITPSGGLAAVRPQKS